MAWYTRNDGFVQMNRLGSLRTPFLFILSYDKTALFVSPLEKLDNNTVKYKLQDRRNTPRRKRDRTYRFEKFPVDFTTYKTALEKVREEIRHGNTYLLNLTFATPIKTDLSLEEIFYFSKAKFKLYLKDRFVCFSPERFVKIEGNTIRTYPMKGTIDAALPDAETAILSNEKEMAEHVMIVDLMRNDLGIVGKEVRVERFRYIDKITAGDKRLLQVSSEITAKLESDWHSNIGKIVDAITPAGSVTGTPKKKTCEIIEAVENYRRSFYTGIFGIYDGNGFDSAVMIRFIEKSGKGLRYKSGGGITIDSDARSEYEELIDKIYLPL